MSEQTIILSDNILSYQVGYAPLTLTLNPSGFSTTGGPVIKIEYDFDDNTTHTIVNRSLNIEGTGLRGDYYNGINFSGDILGTRYENVDFGNYERKDLNYLNSIGLTTENYSIRWSGYVRIPNHNEYIFRTLSDDGVRLWIDNILVIDNWNFHGVTENNTTVLTLSSGYHSIKLEYCEGPGYSKIQLLWSTPTSNNTFDIIPIKYLYTDISDVGDPRGIPVVHTLIPSASSDPQLYNIKVKVTRGNTFIPTTYTLPLYVYKVNALDGAAQGYFEDVHIINSRVFGADNNKIYTLETVNPRYITFLSHSNRTIADIGNVKILHITYQTTSNNAGYRLLPLDNIITDNDILGDYVIDFRLKNNGNTTLTVSSVSCDNVLQFQPIVFTPTVLQPGEYTTVSLSAIPPVAGSTDNELNGLVYVKSDLETRSIDVSIAYKPILEYISWLMNDTDNSKVQDVSNFGYTLNLTTIYKQPTLEYISWLMNDPNNSEVQDVSNLGYTLKLDN